MGKHDKLIIHQVNNSFDTYVALRNVLSYIVRKKECRYWRGYGVSKKNIKRAIKQFVQIQENFGKANRKRIRHIVISLPLYMDDVNVANIVAEEVSKYIFEDYQVVYAVHAKKNNMHFHLAVNPVSYRTGRKWHMSKDEFMEWKLCILEIVNICFSENGYATCELKKDDGLTKNI